MNEIKFRAWIKKENKMVYGYKAMSNSIFTRSFNYRRNEIEVMQYIGLKDKNGKEIYERDILRYVWGGKEEIDVIEFIPPMFSYRNCMRWNLDQDEIIGNVFENPELLEDYI